MPPKQKTNLPNIDEMINFVLESLPRLETAENENVVLVVGNTGSGKSTLVNYLLGCEMQKEIVNNRPRAVAKNPENEFAKIGHGKESETFYPAVYKSKNDVELALCDCPGFQDNRTKEKEALTYVNTQLVVEAAESIRAMLVVIDIDSFNTDRGQGLRQLVKTLGTLLKNATNEALAGSMLFAITKKKDGDTAVNILKGIKELIKSFNKNLIELEKNKGNNAEEFAETKAVLQLLNLIKDNSDNIVMIDVFDQFQSKKTILQKLAELQTIDKSIFDFSKFDDARVKFNHVVNQVISEARKNLSDRFKLPKLIEQNSVEKTKAETEKLKIKTRKNKLSSKVQLSKQEKILEIKQSNKKIEEYENLSKMKQSDIDVQTSELAKLEAELTELATDELEKYWEDKFSPEKPQGLIDNVLYYFRFFDRKQFSYVDVPFDKVQPTYTNGNFDVYKDDSEQGFYRADYRSDFYKTGDGKVTVYLKRRNIPANQMRIEAIQADIESIKEYIQRKKKVRRRIEEAIEVEKNFIKELQLEHAEIREASIAEEAKLAQQINRLDAELLDYENELKTIETRLKTAESCFDQHKKEYLFFAKICRLLKIDTPLVKAFIPLGERASISHPLERKYTLLHTAANLGMYSTVEYLIKRRVNLNAQDVEGNTPLHHAINRNNWDSATCLVLNGADITIENGDRDDPLTLLKNKIEVNSSKPAKYLLALMLCLVPKTLEFLPNTVKIEIRNMRDELQSRNHNFKEPIESVLTDKIIAHQYNLKLDKAFHAAAFKEMFNFPEIAPLLEILRFAVLGLHDLKKPLTITVDPQNGSIKEATLGDAAAYGAYYSDSHAIYLAGKRDDDSEVSKLAARGTFIHEVNHFVANEVFQNYCNPYANDDESNKQRFDEICKDIYSQKNNLQEILSSVFRYPEAVWHAELIVRIPQLIAMTNSYDIVEEECPELWSYYQEVFVPACQEHLFRLRQNNLILLSNITFNTRAVFDAPMSEPKQLQQSVASMIRGAGFHAATPKSPPTDGSSKPSGSNLLNTP